MAAIGFISVLNLYGLFLKMGSYAIVLPIWVAPDFQNSVHMIAESGWNATQDLITCIKILDEFMYHLKHGLISDEESELPESSL